MQQVCAGRGKPAAEAEEAKVKQASPGRHHEGKLKGVLRNLREGHFKGVADVRLRINFFEELAAMERDSLGGVLEEEIPALTEAVLGELDKLLDSDALDEAGTSVLIEIKMTFSVSVEQSVADFTGGKGIDFGSMLEEIQSAFDSLLESLEPLLAALTGTGEDAALTASSTTVSIVEVAAVMETEAIVPTEEAGDTEILPAASEDTAGASMFASFLDDIQSVFDNAMQQLEDALNAASTVPELSEPTGNGVAYARFVAMYEEISGTVVTTSATGEEQPIDTVV